MIRNKLLTLLTLLFTACGTAYRPELKRAETMMNEHPDSSLKILGQIGIDRIHGRKNKAKYALLYSQALDKNYIDVDDDSIIRVAREYYARHGSNEERAQAFYYYGVVANNAGDIDEAMKALVPAGIYAEKTDNEYIKGLIHSAIGNLYYDQNSLDEAIGQFDKAEASFIKTNQLMNQFIMAYRKGNIHTLLNNSQEALANLRKAESLARQLNDTTQILNLNLSIILWKINNDYKNYSSYKNYLFKIYTIYNNSNIPRSHYIAIGNLYGKLGDIDSANYYLTQAISNEKILTIDNVGVYATLSQNEKKVKNYKKALEYRELFNHLSDSLMDIENKNSIEKLDRKYKTQYLQRSYEILKAKHKLQKLSNLLILILTTIVGGILAFIYKHIVTSNNQKIEEYRLYIDEVNSNYENLTFKYKNLKDQAAAQGNTADKLLELLGRRIDSMKTLCDISITSLLPRTFKERFIEYINLENKENKAMAEDLITLANIIYDDIVTIMAAKFDFTDHEKTFCACVVLDFSKEEIRVLFNHTNISSIYNTRCKIRDKLGLKGRSVDVLKYINVIRDNPEYIDNKELIIKILRPKSQRVDYLHVGNIIFRKM